MKPTHPQAKMLTQQYEQTSKGRRTHKHKHRHTYTFYSYAKTIQVLQFYSEKDPHVTNYIFTNLEQTQSSMRLELFWKEAMSVHRHQTSVSIFVMLGESALSF